MEGTQTLQPQESRHHSGAFPKLMKRNKSHKGGGGGVKGHKKEKSGTSAAGGSIDQQSYTGSVFLQNPAYLARLTELELQIKSSLGLSEASSMDEVIHKINDIVSENEALRNETAHQVSKITFQSSTINGFLWK